MTITLTREEAQKMLDALEVEHSAIYGASQTVKAIETLRAKLSEPEPEPVAYGVLDDDGQIDWTVEYPFSNEPGWPNSVPLYTTPPQREWVGLTEEEWETTHWSPDFRAGAKWAEAKLKEKNGN